MELLQKWYFEREILSHFHTEFLIRPIKAIPLSSKIRNLICLVTQQREQIKLTTSPHIRVVRGRSCKL